MVHDQEEKSMELLRKELAKKEILLSTLRQSEQKYRHFFEQAPTMIFVVDRRGVFVNINAAGVEMLGFHEQSEVVGKRFDDFFTAAEGDFRRYRRLIEENGAVKDLDARMKSTSGEVRDVQLSAALRKSVTGKVKGYEGFVIDITDRKNAERKLAESEIRYKTVLDNSLAAIYMFQDGGYFSYVNPRMVSLLGYDNADEILGKPFWEIIASDDRETVKARGLEREQGEISPRRYTYRMLKKNGEEIWVDMRASHASYLGRPAAVGNFIDITREIKAEEQIRYLSRQLIDGIEEERRSLANDIHDEFGQFLTSLQFEIETLTTKIPLELTEAGDSCAKLISQIQLLADKVRDTTSKLRPDLLDHLGLVPTLRWHIDELVARRPEVEVHFQAAGLKKRLSAEVELVLYRVFQEGLNNIAKYAKARNIHVQLTYSHPDIIFIIRDDGCGFTINESGMPANSTRQGIGILSMKERVASLNGTLTIRSAPGEGTVLRIKIPINARQNNETD